jgi:3-isopropylmalate dehydrogenase
MERFRTEFDAILLGALGDPRVPSNVHAKDILLGSRFQLDLYINLRPVQLLDARYCPLKGKTPRGHRHRRVPREHRGPVHGRGRASSSAARPTRSRSRPRSTPARGWSASSAPPSTTPASHGRRAGVHVRQVQRHAPRPRPLAAHLFKLVAAEYPEIKAFHLYVDVLAMELVRAPERFDVIVTNNLFGDIVTDLGAQIRAASGSRAPGTSTPAGIGCSSRSTAPRRTSPGRVSRTRSPRS